MSETMTPEQEAYESLADRVKENVEAANEPVGPGPLPTPDRLPPQAPPLAEQNAQPEPEKKSVLVRKVGVKDLGWLNRIYVKGRNEVRRKARAGELEAEGYEADENGNYPGIDLMAMVMLSWDLVEKDLTFWLSDLTELTPEACGEDISVLMGVVDEIERMGSFGPLMSLLQRLQGRTSSPPERPTS